MTSCCSKSNSPKIAICPANGHEYKQVKRKTILHHIAQPWLHDLPEQTWYYCDDPDCEIVYFGEDQQLINTRQIRRESNPALNNNKICYCFDVTQKDINENLELCKRFVTEQTKNSTCDCEIRNPSGKCCLKHFRLAN